MRRRASDRVIIEYNNVYIWLYMVRVKMEMRLKAFLRDAKELGFVVEGVTLLNKSRTARVAWIDEAEGKQFLRVSTEAPTYFYEAAIKAAQNREIPVYPTSYPAGSDLALGPDLTL